MKKIALAMSILVLIAAGVMVYLYYMEQSRNVSVPSGSGSSGDMPFGGSGSSSGAGVGGTGESQTTTVPADTIGSSASSTLKIRKISADPVSGFRVFASTTKESVVRYMDRATGHIMDFKMPSFETVRLTNTTIPKIYETVWSPSGKSFVLRYLKDDMETVANYYGKIRSSATSGSAYIASASMRNIDGLFLPDNAESPVFSPSDTKLAYVNDNGSVGQVVVYDTVSGKRNVLYESPLRQISISWPETGTIIAHTKPSAFATGAVFAINSSSGSAKMLRSDLGISPLLDNKLAKMLYSTGSRLGMSLFVGPKEGPFKAVSVQTLADKCAWLKKKDTAYCAVPDNFPLSAMPDAWYHGTESFSDSIFKINPSDESAQKAFDLSDSGEEIDATDLQVSPDDKYLVFRNKNDLSLWMMEL